MTARRSPAEKALRAGVAIELVARGGSMWPLFRTGDWLAVEPATAVSLRRGDIAVVEREHGLIAHRVVATQPLVTRGDRLAADDLPADDARVLGRVRAFRRWGIAVELDGWLGRALSFVSASCARLTRAADAPARRRAGGRSRPRRRCRRAASG